MSDEELGIFQAQAAAAKTQSARRDGLQLHHKRNIAYLDERTFLFIFAIAMLGLFVVWLTASSALVLYGSLGLVLLPTILWGVARIVRINKVDEQRKLQAKAMRSEASEKDV
jgi:Flp pilus assembly protein TadB